MLWDIICKQGSGERLKLFFDIHDENRDGSICEAELHSIAERLVLSYFTVLYGYSKDMRRKRNTWKACLIF